MDQANNNPLLLSIIIPVYNSADFIEDALKAVMQIPSREFEALFVNDGSKDNSADIIQPYTRQDSRIKLINQANGGAHSARMHGVKASQGEWVYFADSDDLVCQNVVSVLKKMLLRDIKTDIIQTSVYSINRGLNNIILTIDEYRKALVCEKIYTGPCARYIRKSLFNDWVYNLPRHIVLAEDLLMNIRLSFRTSRQVVLSSEETYICRPSVNPHSVMKTNHGDWQHSSAFIKEYINSFPASQYAVFLPIITVGHVAALHQELRKKWILPKDLHHTEYYQTVMHEVETSHYKIPFLIRCNLYLENPILRCLLDFIIRMIGLYKRYIKKEIAQLSEYETEKPIQ